MIISTPSFKLAANTYGDPDSSKLALLLPGFLDTKDYPDMIEPAKLLATRGYYAISFDPPGTWESGEDIQNYTVTNYLGAINELIAHFGNRPTLLVGKSMGGYMCELAAASNSHVIAIVPMVASQSSKSSDYSEKWREAGTKGSDRDLPKDPAHSRHFEVPFSFAEDRLKYEVLPLLPKITVPKLFIAGEHDDIILPSVVKNAYDVAGKPKEFYLLKGADHDYRKVPVFLEEVNKVIAKFLDDYDL